MKFLTSFLPVRNTSCTSSSSDKAGVEPSIKPLYEALETPEAWGLTVYLPGVAKEGLDFSVDEKEIRVLGKRSWQRPSDWTPLYRESLESSFELVIEHDNLVDAEKIQAELKDGVLRASLPKMAAIKPRKISIT